MILQYEVLAYGLKQELQSGMSGIRPNKPDQSERFDKSIVDEQIYNDNEDQSSGLYVKFANYFVDDKENLKDIM